MTAYQMWLRVCNLVRLSCEARLRAAQILQKALPIKNKIDFTDGLQCHYNAGSVIEDLMAMENSGLARARAPF